MTARPAPAGTADDESDIVDAEVVDAEVVDEGSTDSEKQ